MAQLDTTGLRRKSFAAIVVLLAAAPLILIGLRLFCHFSQTPDLQFAPALVEVEMFLVYLTLALMLFATVWRRVTGTILAAALWLAAIATQREAVLTVFSGHKWTGTTAHAVAGQSDLFIDPAPLIYCASALVVLSLMMCFKRLRSLDRMYVISIGAFVLATAAIFHATLQGGLQGMLESSPRMIHSADRYTGITRPFTTPASARDHGIHAQQVAYVPTARVQYTQLVDMKRTTQLTERFRVMFVTLCIPVHAAWIFASLLGLAIHKRNLARRMREQRRIEDFVERRFYEFIQG